MSETNSGQAELKPKRDPVLVRQTTTLALSTWDLAHRKTARPDDQRGFLVTMRSWQRLVASFERERGIAEAGRSRFLLRGDARGSCLLIHGISTGPGDLAELGEILHDRGFDVYVLRLPDHGRSVSTLSEVSWESYLNYVVQCYRLLARGPGKVNVIGLGYGATLALLLAQREKPASFTLLAPALIARESFFQRLAIRLRLNHLNFFRRWLGWDAGLVEGMDRARSRVGQIRVPIFAAQCEDDNLASTDSLRFLQRKARHGASRFKIFPEGGHGILASHGEGSLYEDISNFLAAGN